MFKRGFRCVFLVAVVAAAAAMADEQPVRDPMRPFTSSVVGGGLAVPAVPRFALTGVLISTERRVAIVNGAPYQPGATVDGAELVRIERNSVHLRQHGADQVIVLGRPPKVWQPHLQGDSAP